MIASFESFLAVTVAHTPVMDEKILMAINY